MFSYQISTRALEYINANMKFDKNGSVVPTFTDKQIPPFQNYEAEQLQWYLNESQVKLINSSCTKHIEKVSQ